MKRSGGAALTTDNMEDIFAKLPTKSIIRFRIACKSLFITTSTPHFIDAHLHHVREFRPPSILHYRTVLTVISNDWVNGDTTAVLSRRFPSLPGRTLTISNSCNGLLCCSGSDGTILLLNPSLGETLAVREPPFVGFDLFRHRAFIGFHPITSEYKIVRFETSKTSRKVEILTLGTRLWRRINGPNRHPTDFGVAIAETMYWIVEDEVGSSDDPKLFNLFGRYCIAAFDLGTEEFRKIQPPRIRRPTSLFVVPLHVSKLLEVDGNICIAGQPTGPTPWVKQPIMDIWMLDGTSNEWSLMYHLVMRWHRPLPMCMYNGRLLVEAHMGEIGYVLLCFDPVDGARVEFVNPETVLNRFFVHMETLVTLKKWVVTP